MRSNSRASQRRESALVPIERQRFIFKWQGGRHAAHGRRLRSPGGEGTAGVTRHVSAGFYPGPRTLPLHPRPLAGGSFCSPHPPIGATGAATRRSLGRGRRVTWRGPRQVVALRTFYCLTGGASLYCHQRFTKPSRYEIVIPSHCHEAPRLNQCFSRHRACWRYGLLR